MSKTVPWAKDLINNSEWQTKYRLLIAIQKQVNGNVNFVSPLKHLKNERQLVNKLHKCMHSEIQPINADFSSHTFLA